MFFKSNHPTHPLPLVGTTCRVPDLMNASSSGLKSRKKVRSEWFSEFESRGSCTQMG